MNDAPRRPPTPTERGKQVLRMAQDQHDGVLRPRQIASVLGVTDARGAQIMKTLADIGLMEPIRPRAFTYRLTDAGRAWNNGPARTKIEIRGYDIARCWCEALMQCSPPDHPYVMDGTNRVRMWMVLLTPRTDDIMISVYGPHTHHPIHETYLKYPDGPRIMMIADAAERAVDILNGARWGNTNRTMEG